MVYCFFDITDSCKEGKIECKINIIALDKHMFAYYNIINKCSKIRLGGAYG